MDCSIEVASRGKYQSGKITELQKVKTLLTNLTRPVT